MDKTKLSYFAGILDGEGCVTISYHQKRNTHRMRLLVVNTNKDVIDWLSNNFGGHVYEIKRHSQRNPKWKKRFEWHFVPSREYQWVLKGILPFLIIKKRQVEIALAFMATIGKSKYRLSPEQFNLRESLHQELKKLNSRGTGFND